jgi:hypothetical protein
MKSAEELRKENEEKKRPKDEWYPSGYISNSRGKGKGKILIGTTVATFDWLELFEVSSGKRKFAYTYSPVPTYHEEEVRE